MVTAGNGNVLVCERGSMFGYSDLVVDPRNLVLMRDAGCPITADITHALQQPTGKALEVCMCARHFHAACVGYFVRYAQSVTCMSCACECMHIPAHQAQMCVCWRKLLAVGIRALQAACIWACGPLSLFALQQHLSGHPKAASLNVHVCKGGHRAAHEQTDTAVSGRSSGQRRLKGAHTGSCTHMCRSWCRRHIHGSEWTLPKGHLTTSDHQGWAVRRLLVGISALSC